MQAGCEAVRVRKSQVERRRRSGEAAGVERRWLAGQIAPEVQQSRGRHSFLSRCEAKIAERRRVGPQTQHSRACGCRLQREALAQRAGGGRVAAQMRVEQSEPGAGGKQRIAVPCPSARPRPGRRSQWREELCNQGVGGCPIQSSTGSHANRDALAGVDDELRNQMEVGANHLAMVNRRRRFVIFIWQIIRPACRAAAMSDKLALSDTI